MTSPVINISPSYLACDESGCACTLASRLHSSRVWISFAMCALQPAAIAFSASHFSALAVIAMIGTLRKSRRRPAPGALYRIVRRMLTLVTRWSLIHHPAWARS
jgi:hypothetical protein